MRRGVVCWREGVISLLGWEGLRETAGGRMGAWGVPIRAIFPVFSSMRCAGRTRSTAISPVRSRRIFQCVRRLGRSLGRSRSRAARRPDLSRRHGRGAARKIKAAMVGARGGAGRRGAGQVANRRRGRACSNRGRQQGGWARGCGAAGGGDCGWVEAARWRLWRGAKRRRCEEKTLSHTQARARARAVARTHIHTHTI